MYLKVNDHDGSPAYMQIYSQIRSRIVSGAFIYGSRLPSKRELARDCLVSIITVEHAYQLLCDEGFCEMKPRSGCYVKYSPESSFPVSELSENAPPHISGEPLPDDSIPFTAFAAMMRKVLLDRSGMILMKSPNNGSFELREAICRYLSRCRSINVLPEQIVVGSGAEYLYGICIQMLGREKRIALEDPSYEKIRAVYTANGAECQMLRMDNEGICVRELERTDAEILHVTPFNSFPSRITASAERRAAYLQWAGEDKTIIEDDYDSEFILNGKAPETLFAQSRQENVIYINTFSKTVAPSIRVGYMILPRRLLPLYERTVGFYSCTVPMLEQYFLAEWLNSGEFERNISRVRNKSSQADRDSI